MVPRAGAVSDEPRGGAQSDSRDEGRLIERIARRDLRAFEQLYRRYHPRLARFLGNLMRRPQLVEEVLNDTMMVVWNKPESYNGSCKLSTWIFAIAYRKAIKLRARWPDPVEDDARDERVSNDPSPDQQLHHPPLDPRHRAAGRRPGKHHDTG